MAVPKCQECDSFVYLPGDISQPYPEAWCNQTMNNLILEIKEEGFESPEDCPKRKAGGFDHD